MIPKALVAAATSFYDYRASISHDNQSFWEDGLWADQLFFNVFGLELLRGNPRTALAAPDAIVLTASLAKKIFGDRDPMNWSLMLDSLKQFMVARIVAAPPANTTAQFTYLTSLVTDAA